MAEMKHTPGPWEYIASTEHHGAYVVGMCGDICDCYTMSNPSSLSVRNGGDSYPVPFQGEEMDANARLIAAAPDMYEALKALLTVAEMTTFSDQFPQECEKARAALAKAEGRSNA